MIDGVHAAGGLMAPQLWHVGAVARRGRTPPPGAYDSPSGLLAPGPHRRADERRRHRRRHRAFATAAADAERLGFDAVELHGAHGYLIDQFFWEGTNGATTPSAARPSPSARSFAAEIIARRARRGRPRLPADHPPLAVEAAGLRRQAGRHAEGHGGLAQASGDAGADILHCSQRRFWEPEFEGSDLNFAGWAKKLTGSADHRRRLGGPDRRVHRLLRRRRLQPASLDELLRRLDRGDFDLVAVGRALLQDPQWAVKVREGRTDELMDFDRTAFAALN